MKYILILLLGIGFMTQLMGKESGEVVLKIGPDKWNIDQECQWAKDGFRLATRNFGAIETKQRLGYKADDMLLLTIPSLGKNCNYTVQLHFFDSKGNYLGHGDLIKESRKVGKVKFKLNTVKSKFRKKAKDFTVKLWLGGPKGKKIEISELKYQAANDK